jgi:hypothetical protein
MVEILPVVCAPGPVALSFVALRSDSALRRRTIRPLYAQERPSTDHLVRSQSGHKQPFLISVAVH